MTYHALRVSIRIFQSFGSALFLEDVIIIENWFIFIGVNHYAL